MILECMVLHRISLHNLSRSSSQIVKCQRLKYGLFQIGLLSDEQCKARDVRRKTRQKQKKVMEEHQPSPDSNTADTVNDPLESLSQDCRILITSLVQYQDMFELPSEEDVDQVTVSITNHYFCFCGICGDLLTLAVFP